MCIYKPGLSFIKEREREGNVSVYNAALYAVVTATTTTTKRAKYTTQTRL